MDRILEQTLLYDFYGELLTDHQKQIYEDVVFGDYSLTEVAEAHQISRQGVHDLIKRCDRTLREYEEKLGLVRKFTETKRLVAQIHELTQEYERTGDGGCVRQIESLSREIGEL
ncbi:MAG: DNA-binding protein [Lachnospiraceae bacterium]|nr:DNA-binding protein [Lachnospiraceae bacterium]MCD8330351.1 DNA-binding protein [Lachnospiraceae bacterium]